MTKRLIIVRGPSGSGKSTIADSIWDESGGYAHYEADMFFMGGGKQEDYRFDASKLGAAHTWCRVSVERSMFHGVSCIVMSNTSMSKKEIQPYVDMAVTYGYDVQVIRTPGPWAPEVLYERNVHGVPFETLEKQIRRYAPVEGEVEWSDLGIFDGR